MGSLGPDDCDPSGTSAAGLQRAVSQLTFTMHNIPSFTSAPQVIGLCTVPSDWKQPAHLGYHISDFLAFMTLLHREGQKADQVWLSSIDIPENIEQSEGTYAHGEAGEVDGILQGKKVTEVAKTGHIKVIAEPESLYTEFLSEVAARSKNGCRALLIIVCGECTPEQTICFDGLSKLYVSKSELQAKLSSDLPVTLMSAAPFSGGYQVNCFLGQKVPPLPESTIMDLLAKHCGGVFADSMIKHFTHRRSPLLSEEERGLTMYEELYNTPNPTQEQKGLHHIFHLGIQRLLGARLTKYASCHGFDWDSSHDEWILGQRTSPSLGYWKTKWDGLATIDSDAKGDGFFFLARAFGGSQTSQIAHLKYMAKQELESCPGDWNQGSNAESHKILRNFLETRNYDDNKCLEVFNLIEYRSSCMILADITVDCLDLPRPDGKTCRNWDVEAYRASEVPGSNQMKARMIAFKALISVHPLPTVAPGLYRDKLKGVKFWRPAFFLASAIAKKITDTGKQPEDAERFVHHEVMGLFDLIFNAQIQQLRQHQDLMDVGKHWIEALDLKNAYAKATTTVPKPPGLEGSIHAYSQGRYAIETFAPYFGMRVPRIPAQQDPAGTTLPTADTLPLGSQSGTTVNGDVIAAQLVDTTETGAAQNESKKEPALSEAQGKVDTASSATTTIQASYGESRPITVLAKPAQPSPAGAATPPISNGRQAPVAAAKPPKIPVSQAKLSLVMPTTVTKPKDPPAEQTKRGIVKQPGAMVADPKCTPAAELKPAAAVQLKSSPAQPTMETKAPPLVTAKPTTIPETKPSPVSQKEKSTTANGRDDNRTFSELLEEFPEMRAMGETKVQQLLVRLKDLKVNNNELVINSLPATAQPTTPQVHHESSKTETTDADFAREIAEQTKNRRAWASAVQDTDPILDEEVRKNAGVSANLAQVKEFSERSIPPGTPRAKPPVAMQTSTPSQPSTAAAPKDNRPPWEQYQLPAKQLQKSTYTNW